MVNKEKATTEYIVTGATGFIGYVVVLELIKKGYAPVKIITRSEKNLYRFKDMPVTAAIGDVTDKEFVNAQITPGSAIFHLAGVVDIGSVKNKAVHETNVLGCENIVEACLRNKAKKLIYTSSVSVINPPKSGLISEPTTFDYKGLTGQYALSKTRATAYIMDKCKSEGLNAVVVYPTAVIGPYEYNISNIGQVVLDYINRRLNCYVKGAYDFVDVRDVAAAIVAAYEKGKSGEGYILNGERVDLNKLFAIMNKKINRTKMPLRLPLWFVKAALPLAELYYRVRGKKPVFSSCSIKTLQLNSRFDNAKAREELGFNPRPAAESICDMIDWFFENKKELIKPKYRQ
ncbi:MAG TPA: NAD-dependent epimerase/dehydratase family protein [Bacilli bacterium]|nr:NAD-dependent epimerase/dehydratase family protein [Bacilli bacterium]